MFPAKRILIPVLTGGFVALSVTSPSAARGQEGSPDSARTDRPKVGLALGGGGAKGGAHIGVLKVLEELRVPIDYIAGTSAGALIGGLYASGLEPLELERIVRRLDWQELLTDGAPRASLTFARRQDDRSVPSRFEVGFNEGGFRLPSGLITGQNVETTLRALTLPVARVQSFEALPVPFRAVATDIATAEMVVIGEGDLATALRASMSIPGVFAPVEVEGRLLVDGAVVRNLPVDVVKEMGADIVIAVDLSSPLRPREEIKNVADVSSQATRIATLANTTPQRELLRSGWDILLVPDVEHVQLAAFRNLPEAILPGEESARRAAELLRALSVTERDYQDHLAERQRYSRAPIPIGFIRIEGNARLSESVIRARLDLAVGDSLSDGELESSLARVYGLGLFERVDYAVVTEDDRTGIVVRVVEKPWGPGFTRVGLALGNDLERGTSGFTILANHTQAAINSLGGELRAELRIGEGQALSVELVQPLDAGGRFFASAGWAYREELLDVAVSGAGGVSRDVDERTAHVAVGAHPTDWSELRIEARRGAVDRKGTLLQAAPEAPNPEIGAWLGRLTVDRLDDRAFPRNGFSGFFEGLRSSDGLGGDPTYTRLEASVSGAVSRGDHTLLVSAHAGTSYDDPLPRHHDFALGGFRRLSGLRAREITGNHLLFARLGLQRRLAVLQSGLVGGNLYAGLSLEAGNTWVQRGDASLDDLRASVGVYLGLETILGPLYLSLAGADGGDNAFFLFLGKAF